MTIPGIIVHCSDSPQGRNDTAVDIHRWHKGRKFDGIGYHYVILEDGTVENGRPLYWNGAHASGYNSYVGICLIGINDFTEAQFKALALLIERLSLTYKISKDKILGHNQVSTKACPGFSVSRFLDEVTGKQKYTWYIDLWSE